MQWQRTVSPALEKQNTQVENQILDTIPHSDSQEESEEEKSEITATEATEPD